jgi:uncharacterized protein DUF6152
MGRKNKPEVMRNLAMKNNLYIILAVAGGLYLTADTAFAHHASSNYDGVHPVTLTGAVTEFEFVNPHVLAHFDVADENGVISH